MNALVLHAHPDDELLFAGALMLSRPDWTWTTVALTGGARKREYPGISLGFPDEWRILTVDEYHDWQDAVDALDLRPDITFTHNAMGEYGHPHHMAVHRIAHELFDPVWDFYVTAESSVGSQAQGTWTLETGVTPAKAERFRNVYGQDVLDELGRSQSAMMHQVFAVECVTGPRPLP